MATITPPSYSSWDFKNNFVDDNTIFGANGGSNIGGNFLSSESILLCAGPPIFPETNLITDIVPIGVIQNFGLSQNKNIQQLFEIGSRQTILLPGKTFIQSSISRILFDGPSLLHAVYITQIPNAVTDLSAAATTLGLNTKYSDGSAGNESLYLNLASDLFNAPIGLALMMHDNNDNVYAGTYFENCLISAHSLSMSAGQTIVSENVALRISKVLPLAFA